MNVRFVPQRAARHVSSTRPEFVLNPNSIWARRTPAELAQIIIDLDRDGVTVAEMADRLGTTRNSVRGVAFRFKIRLAARAAPARRPVTASQAQQPPVVGHDYDDINPVAWAPLPGAPVRDLVENTGCMWPVIGDDGTEGFCGCAKATVGRKTVAYCSTHHARSRVKGGQK